MTNLKAVIPVAGLGMHMLPATKAIPKEMLPIVDKPMIQYIVDEIVAAGIKEILLVTHASKNAVENHFDTSYELESIDFTPESGRITLSAEVDQEYVTLKVLDTGSGIPDYALSRIFERFYSLPRANGQKSSGLGLAFVSEVARLFNGEVTLRNVQEGGVLASLRLHRHFT